MKIPPALAHKADFFFQMREMLSLRVRRHVKYVRHSVSELNLVK